jgi:uncharacterized protein YbjT (DUF2867 family)
MSLLKAAGKTLGDIVPGLGHFTFDSTVGKIFVTSGTGLIGYRVAISLLEAGYKDVRVGIWKGDRQGGEDDPDFASRCTYELQNRGAEVIDFDWANDDDYNKAVKGVKTVFCTIPHMENWSDVFPTFVRECKKAKVEHFVKLSFLRETHEFKGVTAAARQYREHVPFAKFHGVCDDLLEHAPQDSRISYTILCTSHLMATPLLHQGNGLRKEHKFVSASYGMGVNYVSPNDVADAALVVLLNQKPYRNKVYNLTGPGPITDAEVCQLLSKHYGTEIEHVQLGYHEYKKDVKKRGLPDWLVRDSAAFERMKASGVDEYKGSYTKDLETIIGKQPEDFAAYLTNKTCMRPGLTFP